MNSKLKSFIRSLLPRTISKHIILSGPIRGTYIVSSWHDYPAAILGRTEKPLLNWFSENVKIGDTWLDIGAHYGYTAIALCKLVGEFGRVFAFEPLLSTAGFVSQTKRINEFRQLKVVPFGLGNSESLSVVDLPTTRGMVDSNLKETAWLESILVARLDWLWRQICCGDERIDGIKIDVQGMEYYVLSGMKEVLNEKKPKLVVELHSGVNRSEILDLLSSLGYSKNGIPIAPIYGELEPQYIDDHSYAFHVQ